MDAIDRLAGFESPEFHAVRITASNGLTHVDTVTSAAPYPHRLDTLADPSSKLLELIEVHDPFQPENVELVNVA